MGGTQIKNRGEDLNGGGEVREGESVGGQEIKCYSLRS